MNSPSLPPLPPLFFETLAECRCLDRLRLPPPKGFVPTWTMHVVEVRPGEGDRVYGMFCAPTVMGGAFAFYPDDLQRTALDVAQWHHGAWPHFRKTPRRYRWLTLPPANLGFLRNLEPVLDVDIPRWPGSDECW